MSKLWVSIFAILMCTAAAKNAYSESPIDKGVYSLSGAISYSEYRAVGGKTKDFSVYPGLLYFVQPGVAIGANLGYSKFEATGAPSQTPFSDETRSFGPVVRYYFGRENVYPYVSLAYMYTNGTGSFSYKSLSAAVGLDYLIARNVALEPSITYSNHKAKVLGQSEANSDGIRVAVGLNVFIY